MIEVYTDGACSKGFGGWAWAIDDWRYETGAEPDTTSQRMELRAALEAVRFLQGPLCIVSDSAYVVNCFAERWFLGWDIRGWQTKDHKPVKNRDLWEPLIRLVIERNVTFRKVKGHSGDPGNELVDRLAVEARLAFAKEWE